MRTAGPMHFSLLRVYLNQGIYHEEKREYYKAFNLFTKWNELMIELYGRNHPTTKRSIDCLREPMYIQIANSRGVAVPEPHSMDPRS